MLETAVWGTYYNVTTNLSDLKDQEFKTQASTMQLLEMLFCIQTVNTNFYKVDLNEYY